jgi:hypothetical protein
MADKEKEVPAVATHVKTFGEVYDSSTPWELTHRNVAGKLLVIKKATSIDTSFGKAFLADCEVDGQTKKVLLGGKVLVKQLEQILFELPIQATVKKIGRYYSFV